MVTIQTGLLPSHWQSSCARILLPSETWPKVSVSRRLFFLVDYTAKDLRIHW